MSQQPGSTCFRRSNPWTAGEFWYNGDVSRHEIHIPDPVLNVLRRSSIEASGDQFHLTLPPEQLERSLYVGVNKVLVAAGGRWNRSAKAHIFSKSPKEVLGLAVESGTILDKKKALQAFYTPQDIARRMVRVSGLMPGWKVLEPSAGSGAIASAAREVGGDVTCVEIDPDAARGLREMGFSVIEGDFLEMQPSYDYDCVLMNPPFTGNQDIKHVEHALRMLKSGSPCIAIMGAGALGSSAMRIRRDFKARCHQECWTWSDLPEGTFKESGTEVRTILLRATAP